MFVFVIKEYRKKKGLSIKQLSDLAKISRSYLYKLENNQDFNVGLDIETLRKELHNRINEYGLNSEQVMEISKLIDLLVNVHFKELD